MKKNRKLIPSAKNLKGFREADLIIAFLENPDDSKLPAKTRENYERYIIINNMLMRYNQHSAVIGFLKDKYEMSERKARYCIAETQYIFGQMIKVNRPYEIAYLLELSRKNLEIALNSRDNKKISMALKCHLEIVGPELDMNDMPDFSDFEPHKYSIVLPSDLQKQLVSLLKDGAINLSAKMPSKMLNFKDVEDVESEEVK
ncbi:MAG: hypothetical protein A3F72_02970 [Bacteroidetes bacterium RIFCSPLOWO2_12_FULL_35_15]|nr:MAG: hypothetical protein A3F72_02970 [Bacteroidetes bacterium RIFCSPLOWO2_12_FULL_35_15]